MKTVIGNVLPVSPEREDELLDKATRNHDAQIVALSVIVPTFKKVDYIAFGHNNAPLMNKI